MNIRTSSNCHILSVQWDEVSKTNFTVVDVVKVLMIVENIMHEQSESNGKN